MKRCAEHLPLCTTLVGGLATVAGQLPVFLTGAMAVQLTDDLAFGVTGLGLAVATFRFVGAVTAGYLGKLVDRLGSVTGLRLAAGVTIVTSVGLAVTAQSLLTLLLWLAFGATANCFAQPSANRLLVLNVPTHRQGMAFGIKQSALPITSMLAGLSVPAVALTVGWRWAFGLGVALGLLVLFGAGRLARSLQPPTPAATKEPTAPLGDRRTLLFLAAAMGLSTMASAAVPAFYVEASVRSGSAPEVAGLLLAVASATAVGARLVGGAAVDKLSRNPLQLCACMVAVGSIGLALLALGSPLAMGVGVIVALVGTWGFNGIFVFAVMRTYPQAPGAATGTIMSGGLIGGVVGPLLFGFIAEHIGYSVGWLFTLVAAGAAVGGIAAGALRVERRFV